MHPMENIEEFCKEWLAAWTGNDPENLIGYYADKMYYQDLLILKEFQSKQIFSSISKNCWHKIRSGNGC